MKEVEKIGIAGLDRTRLYLVFDFILILNQECTKPDLNHIDT